MALQDTGIFIASSLIADTPEKEKDKENAEPTGDTPAGGGKGPRSGESGSRSARKSLLGRRRSSVGRRLSGFGGGGFDANADQSKLTSMYSSIIKLSSENKITRDKCWGLHLIDYMDRVILDEGGQMGGSKVNFQKASCTLDASVKIYSHRVDATHISSYSLLDNLNRSDNDNADKGAGAVVGSSERSARLGVHETLKKPEQLDQSETDRAFKMDPMFHKMSKIFDEAGSKGMLLNNLSVSDGCKVSFDSESSAAATAPPSPEGAEDQPRRERVFRKPEGVDDGEESKDGETHAGEDAGEQHPAVAEAAEGMTNIKDLRSTLFSLCGDLSTLALCPQLEEFRDQIAEIEEETDKDSGEAARHTGRVGVRGDDVGAAVSYDTDDSDGGGGGGGFGDIPGSDAASVDGGGDFGGGGDDEGHDLNLGGGGGADDDDADPFQADNGGGFGGGGGTSFLVDGDGEFGAGFGSGGGAGSSESGGVGGVGMVVTPVTLEDRLCVDMKIVNDDYAFYDTGALAAAAATSSNNNWAGASHWKFVGVKKKRPVRNKRGQGGGGMGPDGEPMVDEDGNELDAGGAMGGRKARGKRRPPAIDFDAPPVAESALAPPPKPKSRGRRSQEPTLLSEDYVKRAFKAAEDGSSNYALPENARFKTKDLGELFLRTGAFTKRWAAGEAGEASEGARVDLQGFHDTNNGGGSDDDLLFADADDGYGGGDDFDDDDDDDDGGGFQFGGGGFEAVGGDDNGGGGGGGGIGTEVDADGVFVDNFEGQGLLAAGRRVEKINVNYAKKAKRVDVRRLKGDLWRKINTEFQLDAAVVDVDGGEEGEGAENTLEEEVENKDVESKSPADGGDKGKEEAEGLVKPAPEVVDMTFSNIVCDVASKEEQTGVTVPFYFICLLHLANEKGLKLEGRDDLLDFSVASDPVKEGSY